MFQLPRVGDAAPDFDVVDGSGARLRLDELRGHKVVLMFRRYLGCSLCRAEMTELGRRYEAFRMREAKVLVFVDSAPGDVIDYVRRHQPEFHLVADPRHLVYAAYGVRQGGLGAYLQPAVLMRAAPALLSHGHGLPAGSELQLPGDFVIDERGQVRFAHVGRHIADVATVDELIEHCRA